MRSVLFPPDDAPETIGWRDDVEEYHTIKLHDEAREAIMIGAAHLRRPDLPMATQMPATPDDDKALAEAGPKGYLVDAIAPFEAALIIPGGFERVSFLEDPLGDKRLTCSRERLRNALREVRRGYWNDEVEPAAWLERGLVFARGATTTTSIDGQETEIGEIEPADSLKGNAEFAYAVFSSILDFSDRNQTAIVTSW
jgi:hypothetical protein